MVELDARILIKQTLSYAQFCHNIKFLGLTFTTHHTFSQNIMQPFCSISTNFSEQETIKISLFLQKTMA